MTCGRCLNQHHPRPYVPHGIADSPIRLCNLRGILRMPSRGATDSVQGRGCPRLHNHSHIHTRQGNSSLPPVTVSSLTRDCIQARSHTRVCTKREANPQGVRQERGDPQRYSLLCESVGRHEPDQAFSGPLLPNVEDPGVVVLTCPAGRTLRGFEEGTQPNEQTQSKKTAGKRRALFHWQLQYLSLPAGRQWYDICARTLVQAVVNHRL